jgi:chaperonin cofactor prefoldin
MTKHSTGDESMRKYIIGAIFGAFLATSVSAHAEVTNLINQVVQGVFPVTVDDKPIGNAIVVDNKTYLPVRDFGEAVGYKVTFTDDQKVVLTKNATTPDTASASTTGEHPLMKPYRELNDKLGKLLEEKQSLEMKINDIRTKKIWGEKVDETQVNDLQKQVDDIQSQIDKLIDEKRTIESQLQTQQ